jgi:hypothetical protein
LPCQLRLAEKRIIIYSPKLVIRNSKAYCVYYLLTKSNCLLYTVIAPEAKKDSKQAMVGPWIFSRTIKYWH